MSSNETVPDAVYQQRQETSARIVEGYRTGKSPDADAFLPWTEDLDTFGALLGVIVGIEEGRKNPTFGDIMVEQSGAWAFWGSTVLPQTWQGTIGGVNPLDLLTLAAYHWSCLETLRETLAHLNG